jgi:parallel beta-helix repeat protein
MAFALTLAGGTAHARINERSCPAGAIAIEPGVSIQAAVDRAGDGAVFCLKNGIHRAQAVRPRARQHFVGEGHAVLNGSGLITSFQREGRYWVAANPFQPGPPHGECLPSAPTCDRPQALFIDDRPLVKARSRRAVARGLFYIDYDGGKIYLADDPTGHIVEATMASFTFKSAAADVSIDNLVVEKYGNAAQDGTIDAREGTGWRIEDCEVRLNSATGVSVGTGSRLRDCDIHHNGQMGVGGNGNDIVVERNRIWSNNIYGFDPEWESGGAKIAESDGVAFRGNHVYDNNGVGLWCDIDCRNVIYEDNLIENNRYMGIHHEISFRAVIRNNVVRHNGSGKRTWFWGADIDIAASQDVEVTGNKLTVAAGGCGIVLIDQGRRSDDGKEYKTRNNTVHGNEMTFEGAPCAGGTSDTMPYDENFDIIAKGNNRFDDNIYRAPRQSGSARFVWGREVTDWDGFRRKGLEQKGRLILF